MKLDVQIDMQRGGEDKLKEAEKVFEQLVAEDSC